ncbi:MAG TPA: hypothetical protein VMV74_01960 [Bacteroidales bacterium]|nr:hypothetical protein [Bacteroidales bacterium]
MFQGKKIKELEAQVEALESSVTRYRTEAESFKKRCIDLEDAFKTEHGITVRQEITKVIADFSKLEMIVMMAGVQKLMSDSSVPEDIRVYLELDRKIQELIKDMDEKEVGSGKK